MTTAMGVDLKRKYTAEERDTMFEAYIKACETGDDIEADRMLELMPIHPRWAKIIAKVMGKEYLLERFNITYADEVYGEDWLNKG